MKAAGTCLVFISALLLFFSLTSSCDNLLQGNCCGHCCVYFVLRNLSVATPFTFCFAPFSACLGGSQRTILEQKYGLSSQGFCCNCCIHTWCSCCALIQEQKAVQHFEKMGCSPGSPQQIQMQSFSLQTSPIYAQQAGQLQLHQPVMIRT